LRRYNLAQFRASLLRLNINPADPSVVEQVRGFHSSIFQLNLSRF
jgi:hypothetical protein